MVSNVQSHYRKVTQGTLRNPESFCTSISPSFFRPVSAALLLLKMVIIVPVWAIMQLEVFLTPLLATFLQLIDQCIPKLTA